MLLRIVNQAHSHLEILSPFLVSKLSDMAPRLSGFTPIPRSNYLRSTAKRTKTTPARYQRRIPVRQQLPNDRRARVGTTLVSSTTGQRTLIVIMPHASMADTRSGRQDEF